MEVMHLEQQKHELMVTQGSSRLEKEKAGMDEIEMLRLLSQHMAEVERRDAAIHAVKAAANRWVSRQNKQTNKL